MIKKSFVLFLGFTALAFPLGAQSKYFDIAKNLEIYTNVYKELNHSYVDELDPNKLMRVGLDAMVGSLDPFTNYISETDIEGYRYQTEGRYSGLGASGKLMGDYVVITDIYEGSAAQKAGIKVGDAIVSVEGRDAKGKTEIEVMEFLRGFPGTKANLVVRRPGASKDLPIVIERQEVESNNVPHFGIVAENIGYIYLSTFTKDASRNVANAFRELKKDNPDLKGLILDLRYNGGGLLTEAVHLSNVFLPQNELIVSTRGKVPEWDREFRTLGVPVDLDLPVVVLINHMSASASEIVCGSIQDLDRGVLMGQRSYGKGLVQNTKDIGYNGKVKLTTAKYYIPSGRCIQAVRYDKGKPVDIPDEERARFKTRNGRTVLDGGGVKPDIVLPLDTATGIVKALLDQHLIFDYVTQYVQNDPVIDSIETYAFDQWDEFTRFVAKRKFEYRTDSEKQLELLEKEMQKEGFPLGDKLTGLKEALRQAKADELTKNKDRIIREIEQEIIGRYFFESGKVRKRLKNDPDVEAAVQLLNDPVRYKKILEK